MSPRYDFNRRIRCVELNGTDEVIILEFVPLPGFTIDQLGEAISEASYRTEDGHPAIYVLGARAFEVEAHGKRYRPIGQFSPL